MHRKQIDELLYQALETELGGVQIYSRALRCVQHADLRKEWEKYLEETRGHVLVLRGVFEKLGLDPDAETPGRLIVREKAKAQVAAMDRSLQNGPSPASQLVAVECVVEAETKDHLNWELIGKVAENLRGAEAKTLREASLEVEGQEDEHLYHSMGWARELWIESLGLPAVLPPPEEEKHVKTAIGAARAKQSRDDLLEKN